MLVDLRLDIPFFFRYLLNPPDLVSSGLSLTISVSIVAQALGVIIGFPWRSPACHHARR